MGKLAKRTRHVYEMTLEILPAVGKEIRYRIDYTYAPASFDFFDAKHGAWLPGDPENIDIEDVTLVRDGRPLACPNWLKDYIIAGVEIDTLTAYANEDRRD